MTKDELEELDDDVVYTIIELCKQLYCEGKPLFQWDKDALLEIYNDVFYEYDIS